ncbi:hypothetical protein OG760_35735 [Streptomyces sp. NBC_00963]|uniref:hypothetical protein n=1 Tax=Streptomyces sp. NBC_00963 TaxID=2903697 RepID=UPI00386D35AE|nr:hypothetical protein OG760_35735 [Streptomyces sp. NBC_00963]
MGHRPEVFVRPVGLEEGRRLQRISRTAKDPVRLRRVIVVMMSAQGKSVPDITSLMQVSAGFRRVRGLVALSPVCSGVLVAAPPRGAVDPPEQPVNPS